MEPDLSNPNGSHVNTRPSKLRRWLPWLAIIIIALLIIIGDIIYFKHHHNSSTNYSSNALSAYKLSGSNPGQGVSFKKPSQLNLDSADTKLPNQVIFTQASNNQTEAYMIAYSPVAQPLSYQQNLLKSASEALTDPKNPSYLMYASIPKEFIEQNIIQSDVVVESSLKSFTNQFIKNNAWQMPFNINNPTTKKSGQGVAIYVLGHNNYYLFMVFADSSHWQPNQSAWQQVLSSIRVDQ